MQQFFKYLEEEYGVNITTIINTYNYIIKLPFVENGLHENLCECLEIIIQDIASEENIKKTSPAYQGKTISYCISDALYRVYEKEAYGFLSSDWLKINKDRYFKSIK